MAIYIQIRKTEENDNSVTYSFGPSEKFVGTVELSKSSGAIRLIGINEDSREEFYLPRVATKLSQHFAKGEFPAETCYAA